MKTQITIAFLAFAAFVVTETAPRSKFDTNAKQLDVLALLHKVSENEKLVKFPEHEAEHHVLDAKLHILDATLKPLAKHQKELNQKIKDGKIISKTEIFSLFNETQRQEAIAVFDALMETKNWEDFRGFAQHYRHHLNTGVFVYGFFAAVTHSKLTEDIALPPLYEIVPHYFAPAETIQKACDSQIRGTKGHFHIKYTGSASNPEQKVAYFGEDIGMNVHHVSWHLEHPFWWKKSYEHQIDRKGELFFWAHHQLVNRFDAERLSNNLNFVDELSYDKHIVEGFAPFISYPNGVDFPFRPADKSFEDVDGVIKIREILQYEDRILKAIDAGYVEAANQSKIDLSNTHGIEVLGALVEASEHSVHPKYYGNLHNLGHIVLGRQGDPHNKYNLPPSVMEHFETATRDPSFFRLHKYKDNIFRKHKDSLPPYTPNDVVFAEVGIDNVEVQGKLETYFEPYNFDLKQAIPGEKNVDLSAEVQRLNHDDFTLKVDISNNNGEAVVGTVRVYLCPRKDNNGVPLSFNERRWKCIEVDKFWHTLNPGKNTLERKSTESSVTSPDQPSFETLRKMAKNNEDFSKYTRTCGIPNRLLLPKGRPEGLEFTLVVAVTNTLADTGLSSIEELQHESVPHAQCGFRNLQYVDKRPLGYPFDRVASNDKFGALPNLFRKTVTITHREH